MSVRETTQAAAPLDDPRPPDGGGSRSRARGWRANLPGALLANAFVIAVVVFWHLQSTRSVAARWPAPLDVVVATGDFFWGDLAFHTLATVRRVLIAVVVALVAGASLVMLGRAVPVLRPMINRRILPLFNAMPALGWAILGVIWLGVSDTSVLVVEVAILIPFTMINLSEGINVLDQGLLEMGRSFTRSRSRVLRLIEVPLLVPYLFAALRLSFGVGFKVAVIAEFFGAREGLGLVMNQARQSFNTPRVYATILTVLLIVFAVESLVFDPIGRAIARRIGTTEAPTTPELAGV